ASDALCREYGLSVIENPKRGKSKHYSEWNAERNGQPTYRSTVKNDIDICIRRSMTERQFFERLQKLGYEIKGGKDISVRAFGRERSVRLQRNFGSDYSIEGIRNRILSQTRPEIPSYLNPQNQYRYKGRFQKPHRNAGLRALYFYYLHRLGHFNNKTREPTAKQIHYAYREDIRYARRISQEIRLLVKHGIDTDVQLDSHKQELQTQLDSLNNQRKLLRNKLRSANTGDEEKQAIKDEISELSKNMSILRRDISMCDEIEVRSKKMENNIKQARNDMKTKGKEVKKYELFRGRR
ncbi:MAG: relaxase/mobilization nuclease domain-containing protein, partial [Oscillospiraceae bacterium]|nr:relaxase/mobilization nuclease domain-containing protein [Oscillospiraceae bacterium]